MRSLIALPVLLLACNGDKAPADTAASATTCAQAADAALRTCVTDYSAALATCAESDGVLCDASAPGPAAALSELDAAVEAACAGDGLFGLSVEATVDRLHTACASESDSLAWRAYGGPQSAVWSAASDGDKLCLSAAHEASVQQVVDTLGDFGGRADAEAAATSAINGACPDSASLIAIDTATLVERAALQADCLGAAVREDADALDLECGPSNAQFDAPRGEWTRVRVDPAVWPGAICGDGSDYSFWIRPAPEGADLDRVLIGLQGGGVCVFEEDCGARFERAPELFTAEDDEPVSVAMVSDDPAVSPFADWTKVYLPYCNQDVFAGGGAVEQLGDLALPRAGGVNLRSAVRMTRDWLWREMDTEGDDGFRPDQVTALFGGWSAGSYGALYNYHWMLDDLQWPRTIAFPDAGLALDNGQPLGVAALGLVKIPIWGTLPNLPPYCFDGDCALGPVILEALSPRLRTVPEQQVLLLSNPLDDTQMGDAYFQDRANWINTMRQDYCGTKDLNGIHWYLTSVSDESVHVVTVRDELWAGDVAGQAMKDWVAQAVDDPDALVSRAEEADFVQDVPGVEPFPCEVAP